MSRSKAHHWPASAINSGRRRARQAAALLRPAAGQVMPLARTAGAAARHQADRTRAWAAPQVDRAGQVFQDSVAPRVSTVLSAAARRLEPEKPRRRRWRKVAAISATAAAASAIATAVRGRVKATAAGKHDNLPQTEGSPSAAKTPPAADTGNGQRRPSSDVSEDSAARTS